MGGDRDWASYWRDADRPLEAMRAHFEKHTYHRHSHDAYSFGVTEMGAQAFRCRGADRTSGAGMVMAFNPDDPHDGRAAIELGFTYRIIHIGPDLVLDQLRERTGRPASLPLFTDPVLHDPVLARALLGLEETLREGSSRLAADEALAAAIDVMIRRGTRRAPDFEQGRASAGATAVRRMEELLRAEFARNLTADDLAAAAGQSRFAVHRSFRAKHGMAPSDFQRQLRLRAAREMLAQGQSPAEVAAAAGFADQSHLTRWFSRYYGITPGTYRLAGAKPSRLLEA